MVLGTYKEALSARSTEQKILDVSQDGGIVSALLCYALDEGIIEGAVVAGTPDDDWRPIPTVVTSADEVIAAAGTKYSMSPTLSALKTATRQYGIEKLGVVATPCQTQGLRKAQAYPFTRFVTEKIKLLIGIYCMENFPMASLDTFATAKLGFDSLQDATKMDIGKGKFWLTKDGEDSGLAIKETHGYEQSGCNICMDYVAEWSDVSTGSVGSPDGWSTVLTRTDAGADIFKGAVDAGLIETKPMDDVKPGLPLLEKLAKGKKDKNGKVRLPPRDITSVMLPKPRGGMVMKFETPLLDQLETGPWPSVVSDIKQEAASRAKNEKGLDYQIPQDCCEDLLGLFELSYKDKETHWKHGGIVGVFGYGGGVIGRYCDQPEMFPGVAHFHTIRVAQPSGKYYKTDFLRQLCDIWELRGSGMTNMHGSTGDIVLLGTTTPQLEEIFWELTHNMNNDLGGSGSNLRTPAACLGMSRCEFACYNTQDACYTLTQDYQDELHRPAFPYKFKFKFDGCPNGCVCAMARSDFAVVGTWKDDIKIDQDLVKAYVGGELKPNAGAHGSRDWGKFDIQAEVIDRCPTHCMKYEDGKLSIDTKNCVRCMHCIDTMPRALHIGDERGASVLCGAKAPVVDGAQMGSLLVPFIEVQNPYDELKEVIEKIWDWWIEEGKNRERLGELMKRQSFQKLLDVTEIPAQTCHVVAPRNNPYIFFKEEEVPGGFERDLADYRSRHQR